LRLDDLHRLRDAGLVPAERFLAAAARLRDGPRWEAWGRRALLAAGLSHLLAGVIFFFAFNWADLSSMAKFALLGGGTAAAALAAILVRLDSPAGQALLISASVLIGGLLAVIGQVYQTGADTYELFAFWALLILPWVAVSRSAAHWVVWLVVAGLAAWFYGADILMPTQRLRWETLTAGVALRPAVALALREAALVRGWSWIGASWERLLLLGAALALAIVPALSFVLSSTLGITQTGAVGLLVLAVVTAAALAAYARLLPDRHAVVMAVAAIALVVAAAGGRALDEAIGFTRGSTLQTVASLALLVPWLLLVFAAAAVAVRHMRGASPRCRRGEAMELDAFCREFGIDEGRARAALAERGGPRDMAVEALLGLGAWLTAIAAVALVGVILVLVFDVDEDVIGPICVVLGLAGFAGAIRMRRQAVSSAFRRQLATATGLAGGALIAAGMFGITHEIAPSALASAILTAVVAGMSRDGILQFLLAGLTLALAIPALDDLNFAYRLEAAALLTAVGVALQLRPPALDLRPIAAVALLTVPVVSVLWDWPPLGPAWGARAIHAVLILCISYEVWAGMGRPQAYRAALGAIAAVGVIAAALLPPEASVALIMLLIAVAIGSWRWAAAGALLEALFLFRFYYELEQTLLAKSGLLVAVGAALLAAYVLWARRPAGRAA
jgi:uncharacterized membrane protein